VVCTTNINPNPSIEKLLIVNGAGFHLTWDSNNKWLKNVYYEVPQAGRFANLLHVLMRSGKGCSMTGLSQVVSQIPDT